MHKSSTLLAALALGLVLFFSFPARADQDSPSLGDLARQAQKNKDKDKASKPAAKVITNDEMPSGSAEGGGPAMVSTGLAQGGTGAGDSPAEKLAQMEKVVSMVGALDKATLVRTALQDKSGVDFPGRAAWEQRLVSARDNYVVQSRSLLQKARAILASAESLKDVKDENDPRVKEINNRLQYLIRDAVQTDAGVQSVIMEGRDLASQAGAR